MRLFLILVHFWYGEECCHDQHCRRVPCDEISDTANGWKWHDKVFTRAMLRVSPDGECHVCHSIQPLCIFLPPRV